jgi:HlyD family secretion protein
MMIQKRPAGEPTSEHLRSLWRQGAVGACMVAAFVGALGLWAASAQLSGAVVAGGQFVVQSNVKKVQHPTGGIVGELLVKEGDLVQVGDLLIRLDETVLRANLQVIVRQSEELRIRATRLACERAECQTLEFPSDLVARSNDPDVAELIASERALFAARREAQTVVKKRLRQRIQQLMKEVEGLEVQKRARTQQSVIAEDELEGLKKLKALKLIHTQRYNSLERDFIDLEGQKGQLEATIAQSHGKIEETELQIVNIDEDLRAETSKELTEVQPKIGELVEQRIAAEDQLKRTEIRAPQTGFVHQLAVHTVGGVIAAGEPVLLIVPMNDPLRLEVKVAPQEIDQLFVGQEAMVRINAFNRRTTPELAGHVAGISADVTRDPESEISYYLVRLSLADSELQRLGDLRLVAGMQAEALIKTSERTFFEYLLKPLSEQMARAFRDR